MSDTSSTKRVVEAVLSLIDAPEGVEKHDTSLETKVVGHGVLTAEVTDVQQMNFGLPDWKVTVSVIGQTFVTDDPDKAIIRALYDSARKDIIEMTPATVTTALDMEGVDCVGVLQINRSSIGLNGEAFNFSIDFALVISGADF